MENLALAFDTPTSYGYGLTSYQCWDVSKLIVLFDMNLRG